MARKEAKRGAIEDETQAQAEGRAEGQGLLMRRRIRRLFIILVPVVALACGDLPGILGPVNDALGIVCETRAALLPAHAALNKGDVGAAIDILKAYLVQNAHDEEVAALLQLLEAQVRQVLAPPPGYGNKVL